MTSRERRVTAWAVALVTLAVVLFRVAPRCFAWEGELRERVALRQRQLWSSEADVAALAALEDSGVAVRREFMGLAPLLLPARTDAEAESVLAMLVRATLEQTGARVERTVPMSDSSGIGVIERTSVQVTMECDAHGLARVISALTTAVIVLEVDSLRLAAQEPSGPATQPERLRVELVVRGWSARTAIDTLALAEPS